MKKFLFLCVFILSGCSATSNELRQEIPAIEGKTNKKSIEYIGCVLNYWNERNTITPISFQPYQTGYTAQITDMARGVVMLLDASDNPSGGSVYKFYKKRDMSYYEDAIRKCK
ncbi:hypothetical protein QPK13_13320 [Photorhabdus tasmaniensis]